MIIHLEMQGDVVMFSQGQTHLEVCLEEGSGLNDLLDRFRIEPGDFWKASINGRLVDGDAPLSEGDRVIIFPPIGGGAVPGFWQQCPGKGTDPGNSPAQEVAD